MEEEEEKEEKKKKEKDEMKGNESLCRRLPRKRSKQSGNWKGGRLTMRAKGLKLGGARRKGLKGVGWREKEVGSRKYDMNYDTMN